MTTTLSALFAGLIAMVVPWLVEKLGGRLGGVIGTLPTTIVPAVAGIWLATGNPEALAIAMAAVPAGMLVDAGFLYTWRVLPPRLPGGPLWQRLALVSVASLATWAVLALMTLRGVEVALSAGITPVLLGIGFIALHLLVGILACLGDLPAPKGRNPVSLSGLAARGLLAALAVGGSVAIAGLDLPALAGLSSVFPAIFLTTMISLWWAQGEAVQAGAVGPMMLGGASVGGYALVAMWSLPNLGLVAGSGLAWLVAVCLFTAPSALWLQRKGGR